VFRLPLSRRRGVCSLPLLAVWLLGLSAFASGKSDPMCPHIVACEYEAPSFTIHVVDQITGQPLADVHAIATWLFYGGPRRRGPLMVLEAVSGSDGRLTFPAWGPIRSGVEGVLPSRDPFISLFRPGYRALLIYNDPPPEQSDNARVRAFERSGHTFGLTPFRGSIDETITELRKADDPFEGNTITQRDPLPFRQAYVSRLRRVRAEVRRFPTGMPQITRFLRVLDEDIRLLGAGGQP
jgi:hypothetical protein